jgi:hypothetical protein
MEADLWLLIHGFATRRTSRAHEREAKKAAYALIPATRVLL